LYPERRYISIGNIAALAPTGEIEPMLTALAGAIIKYREVMTEANGEHVGQWTTVDTLVWNPNTGTIGLEGGGQVLVSEQDY